MNLRLLGTLTLLIHVLTSAPCARAQVYEKMFSFADAVSDSPNKGSRPISGLVQDLDGNFYGTTLSGGTLGDGTVFKMTPDGVLTTLVDFTNNSGASLGRDPVGDLLRGRDGNLYGTTTSGGASGLGTVFKMTPAGVLTTLVQFTYNPASGQGNSPTAGLVQGIDGNFYGTTVFGGVPNFGTVFKMTPAGVLTTLVQFTGTSGSAKGSNVFSGYNLSPQARLMQASDGNFYGATPEGGAGNFGTIFKMTPAGVLTTLVEFTGTAGASKGNRPLAALMQDSNGNFYGTTEQGGASGYGTVFKMSTDGTPGGTTLTTLVEFAATNGAYPAGGVARGSDGSFYGTTSRGGIGYGTVFQMSTDGTPGGTTLTTLVSFTNFGATNKGSETKAGLVQGSDGNFYGTTYGGGINDGYQGYGTVFKITPGGTLTTVVAFTGSAPTGTVPDGGLIQASDGNFYGTTARGGPPGVGTVYKMTPGGDLTTLVAFDGNNGGDPHNGLLEGSDGNFYGATGFPYVFKMTPAGALTTLAYFDGTINKGSQPRCVLVEHSNGDFYGTTAGGGDFFAGTVFKMTPAGVLTTLVHFTDNGANNKGANPFVGMVKGGDGNFYGTTGRGGASGFGTAFKLTPAGALTTLVEFTGNGPATAPQTFSNSAPIGINDGVPSAPYPSPITVTGVAVNLARVRVSLKGLRHTYPDDIRVLLVSPSGRKVQLMSGAGGDTPVSNVDLTFADNATSSLPVSPAGPLSSGTFLPTAVDASAFPPPAPGGSYATTLSTFAGEPANGTWQLYVHDRYALADTGAIDLGWSLELTPSDTRGNGPNRLVRGSDGNLYGTTSSGGASGAGTAFKMTPDGVLTTLVDFNFGNGGYPPAGLLSDADGHFYGTTNSGGAFGKGTVFKMTPAGGLTTLVEFTGADDGSPSRSELIRGTDGNLYGTVSPNLSAGGSIYRVLFPGAPLVALAEATPEGTTSAIVEARVNARGAATTVWLQYGTDPGALSSPGTVIATNLPGFQTQLVGATLVGLAPGTIYYYRFRAVSTAGTTLTPVASFSTLAAPTTTVSAASNVLATSAQFNGTVNARNYPATVVFEWGTDGNTFPNQGPAVPGTVTGNTAVPVSRAVAGLVKGTTYFYRIVATNAADETISGTQSFTTLTDPVTTVGVATAVTSQSATLNGTVNALEALTSVVFEYGTVPGSYANSVGATPATVNGNVPVPVSVTLSGLTQGATYYYRVKGTSLGGMGVSTVGTFSPDVLSGFAQTFPGGVASADRQGFVIINLIPSGLIVPGWRFVGEQVWRASGVPLGGLETGDRAVEYRPVPGFIEPPPETVNVISGGLPTVLTREYYETGTGGSGGLTVTLTPPALADPGVAQSARAQWRFLGQGDPANPNDATSATWRNSGATVTGLVPGDYLVECKPVAGRTTPPPLNVTVVNGQTSAPTMTYLTPPVPPPGLLPGVLSFETVSGSANLPYAYVGQIRSVVGLSTGFVVKQRVVATAAHVVFDSVTLSATVGVQWLFQRDRGTYEPAAQLPRGSYILSGYATQRGMEAPGSSSLDSQTRDVAALWFFEAEAVLGAGRGGFSGFLASEATDNEWLLSARNKILVGYPVDGIAPANQGRMHASAPGDLVFTGQAGLDNGTPPRPYRTYKTTQIISRGGGSGGPLCVQYDDGRYFPAAIYIGGTADTVVRAIDAAVIALFNLAELSGQTNTPHTSAGITQSSAPLANGNLSVASLQVNIFPEAAANGTARWKLGSGATPQTSGTTLVQMNPNTYSLVFTPASGFLTPTTTSMALIGGNLTTINATYHGITTHPLNKTRTAFDNVSLSVVVSGTPTGYQWQRDNGAGGAWANIAGATTSPFTIADVRGSDAGNYRAVVAWDNGSQTSNAGTLTITPLAQTITFTAPAPRLLRDGPFNLVATSSSARTVTFAILSGPATLDANGVTLTASGPGIVTVRASLAGTSNGNYSAAPDVDRTFQISLETLNSWRGDHFTAGELSNPLISGPLADAEPDGINNLLEFGLNLDPKVSDRVTMIAGSGTRGLPLFSRESAAPFRATAEFVRRRASGLPGVTYQIEFTSGLNPANWTVTGTEVITAIDATWERVKVTDSAAAASIRYGRLKVTMP